MLCCLPFLLDGIIAVSGISGDKQVDVYLICGDVKLLESWFHLVRHDLSLVFTEKSEELMEGEIFL